MLKDPETSTSCLFSVSKFCSYYTSFNDVDTKSVQLKQNDILKPKESFKGNECKDYDGSEKVFYDEMSSTDKDLKEHDEEGQRKTLDGAEETTGKQEVGTATATDTAEDEQEEQETANSKPTFKFRKTLNLQFNSRFQEMYTGYLELLQSFRSRVPKIELNHDTPSCIGCFFDDFDLRATLPDNHLKDIEILKGIHTEVYEYMSKHFKSSSSSSSIGKPQYQGRGIAFIGGEKYSRLSLLSIKSLSSFGCNLSIEMIIPDANECELEFCEEFGYQFKQLAIMASSSDEVLLLDSDNVFLTNPGKWFDNEPFKSTGLVL